MDKIPTLEEYENALKGNMDLNKKIVKLGKLIELAYENLFFSINTNSSVENIAFGLVRNAKSLEFFKETAKLLMTGYKISMPHIMPHLS